MKAKQRMTPNPITVSPETSHRDASNLMRENSIRRLPVLNARGRLIGIVTEKDLLNAGPSPATTLSIAEIQTLLAQLKVGSIMSAPVFAVDEDTDLTSVAQYMAEKKVGALPVMNGESLVGIITVTDVLKAFVEVLGGQEGGYRIDVRLSDRKGILAEVSQAVASAGGNILSVSVFKGPDAGSRDVSLVEQGADGETLRQNLIGINGLELLDFHQARQELLLIV